MKEIDSVTHVVAGMSEYPMQFKNLIQTLQHFENHKECYIASRSQNSFITPLRMKIKLCESRFEKCNGK